MFIGEFHHSMDLKKRLIVPSKFRKELGDSFVITRGIDKCLCLYPKDDFIKIVDKLKSVSFTKKESRLFMRFFLSGASFVELDKQGRINIPTSLSNYAFLEKECIIVGTGDRLEIWSLKLWEDFYSSTVDDMSDIADELFNIIDC